MKDSAETGGCSSAGECNMCLLSGQGKGIHCKIIWRVDLQAGSVLTPTAARVTPLGMENEGSLGAGFVWHRHVLWSRQNRKPCLLMDSPELTRAKFTQIFPEIRTSS